jgi:hypothetical protein
LTHAAEAIFVGLSLMSGARQAMESPSSGTDMPRDYDAFLSYTHRDRPVVSRIQKGLHQIGRRTGQLRALRIFRDDTDLTASPDLWGRIADALDRSRFFIATLSPDRVGGTPAEVQARMGHSTVRAAMIYQHAASGRDAEIAAALSALAETTQPSR